MRLPLLLWAYVVFGNELIEQTHERDDSICDSVKQYTGYFKLTTGQKNYFYWFFESRSAPATDPVVMWLTGGPGCSSEIALFGENGPCKVTPNGNTTTSNPYSWNTNANLLYVDQPSGTGFSYGPGFDFYEKGVARDMYDFLQQFYKAHAQYQPLDFFAFGESYAGHYVPAVTHLIWQNNNKLPPAAVTINLKGTAVGNGLTDPEIQYGYYPQMAASSNGHAPVFKEGSPIYNVMKAVVPACVASVVECQNNISACLIAMDVCNLGLVEPYSLTGMNPYDMRVKCAVPPLCYDFSNVGKFLKKPDVIKYLGVQGHPWTDCNRAVAIEFELGGDWMKNYQQMIPDQLAAGIRVLLYAGDQDYICNWLGNQAWTLALPWPHQKDFNSVPLVNFTVAGASAGELRTSSGLSFLRVFNAGHMVPLDQPKVALAMLQAFISGPF